MTLGTCVQVYPHRACAPECTVGMPQLSFGSGLNSRVCGVQVALVSPFPVASSLQTSLPTSLCWSFIIFQLVMCSETRLPLGEHCNPDSFVLLCGVCFHSSSGPDTLTSSECRRREAQIIACHYSRMHMGLAECKCHINVLEGLGRKLIIGITMLMF